MHNPSRNGELTVSLLTPSTPKKPKSKAADLKYDNCGVPSSWADTYTYCVPDGDGNYPNGTCPDLHDPAPEGYDWTQSKTYTRYVAMRDALLNVDRTIFYSLCDWGQADVNSWGNKTGNSWRMSGDITGMFYSHDDLGCLCLLTLDLALADWDRISQIANENSFLMNYVNFWGHPDPDMLEVGNGKLTLAENKAHFALWAVMKSPLIIGTAVCTILVFIYLRTYANLHLA